MQVWRDARMQGAGMQVSKSTSLQVYILHIIAKLSSSWLVKWLVELRLALSLIITTPTHPHPHPGK